MVLPVSYRLSGSGLEYYLVLHMCFRYNQTNKIQRYTMVFITIYALHVSGGSSAHHQELKTLYTTSGICRAFSASYCFELTHDSGKKQKKLDKNQMLRIQF